MTLSILISDAERMWNFVHRKEEFENLKGGQALYIPLRDTEGLVLDLKLVAQKREFTDLNIFSVGVYAHEKKKPTVKKVYTSFYGTVTNLGMLCTESEIRLRWNPVQGLPPELAKAPLTLIVEKEVRE